MTTSSVTLWSYPNVGLLSGQVWKHLAAKWLEDNEVARLFGETPADEQNALARVGAEMRAEDKKKAKGSRDEEEALD